MWLQCPDAGRKVPTAMVSRGAPASARSMATGLAAPVTVGGAPAVMYGSASCVGCFRFKHEIIQALYFGSVNFLLVA